MAYIRIIVGSALVIAGCIHWLILFGFFHEKAPFFMNVYFHSLAVFDIVAGVGILMNKKYGYSIALCIALTQIPAHGYMLALDTYQAYGSGLSLTERVVEIVLSLFLVMYVVFILRKRQYQ